MTKTFKKTYLTEELFLPYEVIEDTIDDVDRWSVRHTIIFQDKDGKYYETSYRCGATELQDEAPWEYDDEVHCTEVEQREVLVKKWVPVE